MWFISHDMSVQFHYHVFVKIEKVIFGMYSGALYDDGSSFRMIPGAWNVHN